MILARKNINFFLNCESGLSEIIAAIMLLAIVVSMIAIIQAQSVPEWNKAVEMDHFNVVYDDFLKIRSDINDVALFQFPKSGVIHMGAHYPNRLIFINPADTSGTLTSTNDTWINVSYTPFNQTPTFFNNSSTSIKFMPNYNYYSNSPSLVYEHGLIIKDFAIDNYLYTDTNQAIFDNNIINVFILAYPQESVSFSGINSLNYNLQSKISTYNNTDVTVTFYTNYPQLWDVLLRKYNLNPIVSGNIVTVDYPGNITINAYTFNGSIAAGTGVSTIPTPTPMVIRAVSLTNITNLSRTILKGTNATYILNLTNNGTDTDSYILTVSNPDLVSVTGLNISSPILLNSGQTRIFTLNVTNTSAGGPFQVNVTATSVNDPTKSGYINSTTTVSPLTVKVYLRNTDNPAGIYTWDMSTSQGGSSDTSTTIRLGSNDPVFYIFKPGQENSQTGTPGSTYKGYGWASETPVNGTIGGDWSFKVKTYSDTNDGNGKILIYVYKYNSTATTYLFNLTGSSNHLNTRYGVTETISGITPYYTFGPGDYILAEYWLKVTETDNGDNLDFRVNTASEFVTYLQK